MKYEVHWVKAWSMCTPPYHDEHHGIFNSLEEAQASIQAWWKKNDFTPRYVRQMHDEHNNLWMDYGNHRAFYVIKEVA